MSLEIWLKMWKSGSGFFFFFSNTLEYGKTGTREKKGWENRSFRMERKIKEEKRWKLERWLECGEK